MVTISGSVGLGGKNKPEDVALVQVMLKNQRGGKQYYADVPSGLYGADLSKNIAAFQDDKGLLQKEADQKLKGLVRPSGATFEALKNGFNTELRNLKVYFHNRFSPVFFIRDQKLTVSPKVVNAIDLRLPTFMANTVQAFLKKAIINFSIEKWGISNAGEFCLTLRSSEKFYDVVSNSVVVGPSAAYLKHILLNIPIKKWSVKENADKSILLKSEPMRFFAGPHSLSATDQARLKYWNIPKPNKNASDPYVQKILSAVVRPWRKIKKKKGEKYYTVPSGAVSTTDAQFAKYAGQALDYYGNYYDGIVAAYDKILERQTGRKGQPLVLLFGEAEIKIVVGLGLRLGLIMDPNNQKEYVYIKVFGNLSAGAGGGLSVGVDTINKSVSSLGGFSYGVSFTQELELGPVTISMQFTGDKVKYPEIRWKAKEKFDKFFSDDSDEPDKKSKSKDKLFPEKRDFFSLAGDTETGERLRHGEDSQVEKRRKERAKVQGPLRKKLGPKLSLPILEVDIGPVIFSVYVRLEGSGKVKLTLGPEVHADYTYVKELDLDYGWLEDGVYWLVDKLLPDVSPLFPDNVPLQGNNVGGVLAAAASRNDT